MHPSCEPADEPSWILALHEQEAGHREVHLAGGIVMGKVCRDLAGARKCDRAGWLAVHEHQCRGAVHPRAEQHCEGTVASTKVGDGLRLGKQGARAQRLDRRSIGVVDKSREWRVVGHGTRLAWCLVNATLMLCDAAQVSEGKLYILGGGWSVTGPGLSPMAIALKVDVSWNEAPNPHHWELFLQDHEGNPVTVETSEGAQPIEVRGDFQIGTPQGVPLGSDIPVNLAINLGPLPLPPGGRFRWVLTIDGESEDDWSTTFSTVALPQGAEAPKAPTPVPDQE